MSQVNEQEIMMRKLALRYPEIAGVVIGLAIVVALYFGVVALSHVFGF